MARQAVTILAALLLILGAAAGPGYAARSGEPDGPGHGGMAPEGMGSRQQMMERGAMAPGVHCNKQCVRDLQRQLRDRGLYRDRIDGIPGRLTKQAVKDYQFRHGMKVTGLIDDRVLSDLNIQPTGRGGEVSPPAAPRAPGEPQPAPSRHGLGGLREGLY